MSRTGCCYDNSVMQRFFWSIKYEWTNHVAFADLQEAQLSAFQSIEMFGSFAESVGANLLKPESAPANHRSFERKSQV
jgi:transposase InsO family protein